MSPNKLNGTGSDRRIGHANDLDELSEDKLESVTGGSSCNSSSGVYTVGGGSNGSQTITFDGFVYTRKEWESVVDMSRSFGC